MTCVVVSALTETAAILLFAELTDNALKAGSLSSFWDPAAAWLGVAVLGALVGYLGNSLATWTAERFVRRLCVNVFRHAGSPVLRAAPVLLLDEPTAGLDSVAARQVVQPLRPLMSGRTAIMIWLRTGLRQPRSRS